MQHLLEREYDAGLHICNAACGMLQLRAAGRTIPPSLLGDSNTLLRGARANLLPRSRMLRHDFVNSFLSGFGNVSPRHHPSVNSLLGHLTLLCQPGSVFVQGFQPACDFAFEVFLNWPADNPWKMFNPYVTGALRGRQRRLLGFFAWGNFHCQWGWVATGTLPRLR